MSDKMEVISSHFVMTPEQQEQALALLRFAMLTSKVITTTDGIRLNIYLHDWRELLKLESFIEVFIFRGWKVVLEESETSLYPKGSILALQAGDEPIRYCDNYEEFFALIAPFVVPGYLEMQLVEGGDDHWRWTFNGKTCRSVSPTITWPSPSSAA